MPLSVFASRELIGRATAIRFTVQFELQGQPHSQTFEHSIYVDGEVQIKLRESAITMIGGVPNFTGSLLNEGAGTAQFSTIEIIECEGWNAKKSSTLYLGDIAENSPLPISIPLDPSGEVETGSYEFHLRVEYKNSLKEIQAIDLRSKVPYAAEAKPISYSTEGNSRLQIPPYLGWLLGGVAIGFVVGRLMFRRNRNQELVQLIQQSKIEGLPSLDDALAMNSSAGTKR